MILHALNCILIKSNFSQTCRKTKRKQICQKNNSKEIKKNPSKTNNCCVYYMPGLEFGPPCCCAELDSPGTPCTTSSWTTSRMGQLGSWNEDYKTGGYDKDRQPLTKVAGLNIEMSSMENFSASPSYSKSWGIKACERGLEEAGRRGFSLREYFNCTTSFPRPPILNHK